MSWTGLGKFGENGAVDFDFTYLLPFAWCFSEGQGRVFYTALGHFPSAYEDVLLLGHLYGGLAWVLGPET
jgi:type 1 glutamine amidotransferase